MSAERPPRPVAQWKPTFGRSKICVTCRSRARAELQSRQTWWCRGCGVKCCAHTCTEKEGDKAICRACRPPKEETP